MAIKQISLKSVPDKLSSARQKEIAILKVGCWEVYCMMVYFDPTQELKHPNIVQLHHYHVSAQTGGVRVCLTVDACRKLRVICSWSWR